MTHGQKPKCYYNPRSCSQAPKSKMIWRRFNDYSEKKYIYKLMINGNGVPLF